MAAPNLNRLFTRGFYGTALNRFMSITTHGWYDTNIFDPVLASASVTQPGITTSVTQPGITISVTQPTVTVTAKNDTA